MVEDYPLRNNKYTVTAVSYTGAYSAARLAVYPRLLGKQGLADIAVSAPKIRQFYQARLAQIRGLGIEPYATSATSFSYGYNCPPLGVWIKEPQAHACKRAMLCPFCWGRRFVMPIYIGLETLLRPPDDKKGELALATEYLLVEFALRTTTMPIDGGPFDADYCAGAALDLRNRLASQPAARFLEYDAWHAVGGAVFLRLYVGGRRDQRCVVFKRSGLLLVPLKLGDALRDTKSLRVRRHYTINRRELAAAVARVCAYPPSVLRADAHCVMALINGLAGVRMFSLRRRGYLRHLGR